MMMRKFLMTAAVAVAALLTPASSRADYTLTLSSGGSGVSTNTVVIDFTTGSGSLNGTNYATLAALATATNMTINNIGTGKWSVYSNNTSGIELNASISYSNSPGSTATGLLDLSSVTVTDAGVTNGFASAVLQNTGYTAPSSPRLLQSTYNGNLGGDSSSSSLVDDASYTDSVVGTQTLKSLTGTASSPLNNQIVYDPNNIYSTATYTLTDTMTISGLIDGDFLEGSIYTNVYQIAPAPSSLILAATMVPFFGLLRRRMQGLKTAAVA